MNYVWFKENAENTVTDSDGGPLAKLTARPHYLKLLTTLKGDNIPLFKMCAAEAKKGWGAVVLNLKKKNGMELCRGKAFICCQWAIDPKRQVEQFGNLKTENWTQHSDRTGHISWLWLCISSLRDQLLMGHPRQWLLQQGGFGLFHPSAV